MQIKFFTIPINDESQAEEDLNRFLRSKKILSLERKFVDDGQNSLWSICVSYHDGGSRPQVPKRGKVDYREVLNEADFAVFAKLRDLRKQLAEKEGVPAYALFTNEQLAETVRSRVKTAADLKKIDGVGEARVQKYGKIFLQLLNEILPDVVVNADKTAEADNEAQ